MAFKDFPRQLPGIELLQRSLERQRLGHAYLFTGDHLDQLESIGQTLAKTLNCLHPVKKTGAVVIAATVVPPARKSSTLIMRISIGFGRNPRPASSVSSRSGTSSRR